MLYCAFAHTLLENYPYIPCVPSLSTMWDQSTCPCSPIRKGKRKYPLATYACKQVIKHAKEKAWSEYGNKLEDMRKTEVMKSLYKKVKIMRERDQPYCPITTIKDAQGQIITDKHQIKQRWRIYFEGLLNPNEDTRDNNFLVQNFLEHEP